MPGPCVNRFLAVVESLFGRALTNADGILKSLLETGESLVARRRWQNGM
jgi:hypothetical protein